MDFFFQVQFEMKFEFFVNFRGNRIRQDRYGKYFYFRLYVKRWGVGKENNIFNRRKES